MCARGHYATPVAHIAQGNHHHRTRESLRRDLSFEARQIPVNFPPFCLPSILSRDCDRKEKFCESEQNEVLRENGTT